MRTTGRGTSARSVALSVMERVLHGSYLAPTLSTALDASGLAGHDRSFVTELSYGAMRRLSQLDHALAPLLKAPDKLPPRVRGALRLGAYEILFRETPPYAAVSAWVAQVKRETPRLAGLINAVLRRVRKPTEAPPCVQLNLPDWLLSEFERALGRERAVEAAEGMLEPEPLWLTLFGPEAEELLQRDGARVEPLAPGVGFPASYRVRAALPLAQLAAYRLGQAQPQNPSSLQAAVALGVGAGDRVLDLAAGRGVKTAVFAALGAEVTALELSADRSAAARENLSRLGFEAEHLVADLTDPPDLEPAPFVMLDAPCSGTGTLRGNPEIKLRLTQESLAELAALQRRMILRASELVARGGVLLYAVCALTEVEGPGVARYLLERRPEFSLEPPETAEDLLPPATAEGPAADTVEGPGVGATDGATEGPANGGAKGAAQPGGYILPLHGRDGFYLARFRRS